MRPYTLSDDFTGANGAGWDATKWQALQGTTGGSTSDIQSNAGRMQVTGGGYTGIARRSLLARGVNVEALFKVTLPTTGEWFVGFTCRGTTWTGAQPADGYCFELDASGNIFIFRFVATARTTVATMSKSFGATVWVRVSVAGAVLRVKRWDDGAAEPGAWDIDTTDGAPILTPGESGVYHFGGAAVETSTSSFDDLAFSVTPTPVVVQDLGTATSNSAGTTLAVSFSGATKPEVGDTVFVYGSRDNATNDPATGDSFSDANGNTYTVIALAQPAGTSTAAAGIVGVLAFSKLTTAWPGGTNTLTWTLPSVTAKAMRAEHWSNLYTLRPSSSGTGGSAAGAPSAASGSTVTTNDLVMGMAAFEHATSSTITGDSDTTNGSWSAITAQIAGGGTNLTGAKVIRQSKQVTAGGAQTYNPTNSVTTNVDAVAIVAAFMLTAPARPFLRRTPMALLAR